MLKCYFYLSYQCEHLTCNFYVTDVTFKMTEILKTTQFKRSLNKIESKITSIDDISGLKAVKSILDARQDQFSPTACIIEALKLSLEFPCAAPSLSRKCLLIELELLKSKLNLRASKMQVVVGN